MTFGSSFSPYSKTPHVSLATTYTYSAYAASAVGRCKRLTIAERALSLMQVKLKFSPEDDLPTRGMRQQLGRGRIRTCVIARQFLVDGELCNGTCNQSHRVQASTQGFASIHVLEQAVRLRSGIAGASLRLLSRRAKSGQLVFLHNASTTVTDGCSTAVPCMPWSPGVNPLVHLSIKHLLSLA